MRYQRSHSLRGSGFTLIELLTVIAIASVLLALAAPSFASMIERYRVRRAAEDLRATLFYARSEAIRRGGRVVLERTAATPDCTAAAATHWNCGWILYADVNGNGSQDPGELTIQRNTGAAQVRINSPATSPLEFNRWGEANGMGVLGFGLVPDVAAPAAANSIAICMSGGGRVDFRIGQAAC